MRITLFLTPYLRMPNVNHECKKIQPDEKADTAPRPNERTGRRGIGWWDSGSHACISSRQIYMFFHSEEDYKTETEGWAKSLLPTLDPRKQPSIAGQWPLHNPGARSCDRTSRRIFPRGCNPRSLFQRPKRPAFSLRGIPSLFSSDDHVRPHVRGRSSSSADGQSFLLLPLLLQKKKKSKGMLPSFGKLCVSLACLSLLLSLLELGAGRLSWAGLGTNHCLFLACCSTLHAKERRNGPADSG